MTAIAVSASEPNGLEKAILNALSDISVSTDDARRIASDSPWFGSQLTWVKTKQLTKAGGMGVSAAIIPIAGYLTLPAETVAYIRCLSATALAVGVAKTGECDEDDFFNILGVWCGSVDLNKDLAKSITAKALAGGAPIIGGKIGMKMATKAFATTCGLIIAKKISPKLGMKASTFFVSMLAGKAGTRWIPGVSALAAGGINVYMMHTMIEAAERYYDFIKKL